MLKLLNNIRIYFRSKRVFTLLLLFFVVSCSKVEVTKVGEVFIDDSKHPIPLIGGIEGVFVDDSSIAFIAGYTNLYMLNIFTGEITRFWQIDSSFAKEEMALAKKYFKEYYKANKYILKNENKLTRLFSLGGNVYVYSAISVGYKLSEKVKVFFHPTFVIKFSKDLNIKKIIQLPEVINGDTVWEIDNTFFCKGDTLLYFPTSSWHNVNKERKNFAIYHIKNGKYKVERSKTGFNITDEFSYNDKFVFSVGESEIPMFFDGVEFYKLEGEKPVGIRDSMQAKERLLNFTNTDNKLICSYLKNLGQNDYGKYIVIYYVKIFDLKNKSLVDSVYLGAKDSIKCVAVTNDKFDVLKLRGDSLVNEVYKIN